MGNGRKHTLERDLRDRRDRRYVQFDIENAAGGPQQPVAEYVRVAHIVLFGSIRIGPGDLVVVAASRYVAKRIMPALAGLPMQWRWQDGPDGADHALLDFADLAHEARRRSSLVIVSGDGIFTEQVERAKDLGMSTHQIIGRGRPARSLWHACQTHTRIRLGAPLEELTTVAPSPAAAA
jgi:hypothetical protein